MSRSFAGSQYLTHATGIVTAAPLTMACWAKKANTTAQYLMKLGVAGDLFNMFGLSSSTAVAAMTAAASTSTATYGSPSTTDWFHAAGVWASATSRIACLNGVMGTAQTTSRVPAGINQFRIGATMTGTSSLSGTVAHAAIWNVALSAEEIDMLGAQRISPLLVRPANLVAYWPLGFGNGLIGVVGGYGLTSTGTTAATDEPPILMLLKSRRIITAPVRVVPQLLLPTVTAITATGATPRVTVNWDY